jgi:hypothetical protein
MFEQEYMALEERLAEMSELKNEYDGCTQLLDYDETRSTKTVLYNKLDVALTLWVIKVYPKNTLKKSFV